MANIMSSMLAPPTSTTCASGVEVDSLGPAATGMATGGVRGAIGGGLAGFAVGALIGAIYSMAS